MRMLSRAVAVCAALCVAASAHAQSTLMQAGTPTSGRVPMYVGSSPSQTIVQDSGPAVGGAVGLGISEMNLTARGTGTAPYAQQGTGPNGEIFCINDAPTTNSTGYHSMCLSANALGGGLLSYAAFGAASALPLQFKVNGTTYEFPFTTSGVVGPSTSVINDAACWNNTTGTLLKDCGPFVTVAGNNTWTGTNNFTGTFQIGTVTQSFPPSGNLVGTSDTQTLTNKSIGASQINSGTLSALVMPAFTGDVTTSAGAVATTIAAGVVTNAKLATAITNTVKGNATSGTASVTDMAMPSCSASGNALQWLTNTGFQCGSVAGTSAGWGLTLTSTVFSISTTQPPYGFVAPVNLGLTASVGGSALTINVVGANGSAPSSTNPVSVPFRSTTLATGTPVWGIVTSALSIVIPSAATLGTTNNVPFRVWIFLAYNGGTPELGVAICSTAAQMYPCTAWEGTRVTTTTINGFATSAGTLYATLGVSNDAVRIIGYAEYSSGLATAGSWISVPTTLQLLGPGIKKPGDVVQQVLTSSTTATTGNGTTLVSTAPSVSITPTTAPNIVRAIVVGASTAAAGGGTIINQIYRTAGASAGCTTAIGPLMAPAPGANAATSANLQALDAPGATAQQTYNLCFKSSTSTNHVYCSAATVTQTCTIEVQEIQGALPQPANDNIHPGIMSQTG